MLAGLIMKEAGGGLQNMGQALESKDGTIKEDKSISDKTGQTVGMGGGGGMSQDDMKEAAGAVKDAIGGIMSDERLKELFGDSAPDLIECFKNIDAYTFKYKDKAQCLYRGKSGVDNDEHVGVMAQELENNPATSSAVHTDENGFKKVDTNEMTMANTAVISEIAKKLEEIENRLNSLEARG